MTLYILCICCWCGFDRYGIIRPFLNHYCSDLFFAGYDYYILIVNLKILQHYIKSLFLFYFFIKYVSGGGEWENKNYINFIKNLNKVRSNPFFMGFMLSNTILLLLIKYFLILPVLGYSL